VAAQVPLLDDGTHFALDLDGIDRALAAGARGVLLCNPHNPVGLVPDRSVLSELSRIVDRHGGFVVSDEIHAPLTYHSHRFVPYLTVSDEAREHGIAALSASKAFNLAGLKCAFFVAESDRMASLIKSLPEEVTSRAGLFGVIAAGPATRPRMARRHDYRAGEQCRVTRTAACRENFRRSTFAGRGPVTLRGFI
jgi:cystathionine beta-lyase